MSETILEQTAENSLTGDETVLYTSTSAKITRIVLMLVMTGLGFYMILNLKRMLPGVMCFLCAALFLFQIFKIYKKVPRLTLNAEGIISESAGYRSWGDITEEIAEKIRDNRSDISYLTYKYGDKTERIPIGTLNISLDQLNDLLAVYRTRYQQNNGRKPITETAVSGSASSDL